MTAYLDTLNTFLAEKRDSREYRRGLAVKMAYKGYIYEDICAILDVSPGYISQWKYAYEAEGIAGLLLKYKGAIGYLSSDERNAVILWLKSQETWDVDRLKEYLETTYNVTFQSRQSYYELLATADITWKKAQRRNPAKDPEAVAAKKKEISEQLVTWRASIEDGSLIVVYVDECHLLWDDARGYVWGKANERVTIPMKNFRERQTYYGAIEQRFGEITCQPSRTGDGEATIAFIELLRKKYAGKRLLILWDGASYHKGDEMIAYLQKANQEQSADTWPVTCIRFAPHAPEQNPMEDMWLKGKQLIRKCWWMCNTFAQVKALFVQALQGTRCIFDKLFTYAPFLEIN